MHPPQPSVEEINRSLGKVKCEIRSKMMVARDQATWKAWQKYYLDNLYTPSNEPHETAVAQAIQVARSPADAKRRIARYHEKRPSSVGADAPEEFCRLFINTREEVAKNGGINPMTGWVQTTRPRHTGV